MPLRVSSALAILLVAYGALLFTHLCDIAGGSDSSGYLNEARMIVSGRTAERIDALDRFHLDDSVADVFVPLGYDVMPLHRRMMVPTYPPGLPMHMALFTLIGGDRAVFSVVPLAAIAAIALMSLLARMLLDSWSLAIASAVALASCAVFVFHALQPVSDVLVTMWSIAAIAAALHARRAGDRWGALAGAAFAIGIWIRPSNILLAPALFIALPKRKHAVIAAAIVLASLLIWNARLYGAPLRTGYGSIAQYLSLDYFPARSLHYLRWTAALLSPFVLLGAIDSTIRAPRDRIQLMLALWWWPYFLFYCFFSSYESWSYTRFLLPAYPALIVSALMMARRVSPRAAPAVVACAMIAYAIFFTRRLDVLHIKRVESIYPEVLRWSDAQIPRDALVVAMQLSGARKYDRGEWSLRWEWLDRERVQKIERAVPPQRWYAVLWPFEVDEVLRRVPGQWTKIGEDRDVTLWHRTR